MQTVLLIEDEEDLCRLFSKKLASLGFQASWTTHGAEALRLTRKIRPDIVLLDLNLGDHHGLAVLKELHAEDPDLPIIILSAQDDVATVVQAMKEGAYYYLLKPWDTHELPLLLKRAADDAQQRRQVQELKKRVGEMEALLKEFVNAAQGQLSSGSPIQLTDVTRQATQYLEKRLILDALVKSRWHRGEASRLLGVDPKTLYNKLKEYGIPEF